MYHLSNDDYHQRAGFVEAAKKREFMRQQSGLVTSYDNHLAKEFLNCRNTSFDHDIYLSWFKHVIAHWHVLFDPGEQLKGAKLRFRVLQSKSRAHDHIARVLVKSDQETVVLWGNGSIGPTSKGHASAPNIGLRRELTQRGVKIVLVDEYLSTKRTGCCHRTSQFHKSEQALSTKKIASLAARNRVPLEGKQDTRGLLYCCSPRDQSHQPTTNPLIYFKDPINRNPPSISSTDISQSSISSRVPFNGQLYTNINTDLSNRRVRYISRPWNRDVNAAINIVRIAFYHAFNMLPHEFDRKSKKKQEQVEEKCDM